MTAVNYDKISEVYDTVRTGDPEVIAFILNNKELTSESSILEIGCGSGNNTVLIKAATGARVYGMDQSKGMLEKAAAKDQSIDFSQGDAVTLDNFKAESFDVVYMVDVIHHIKDIETMFKNIHRILKKDGKVFIFTDTHERIREERLTSRYFPETIAVELERYQSSESILEAMNGSGLYDCSLNKLEAEEQPDVGEYLIRVAETKGYSMFHLISEEAIEKGIERIREDMKKGRLSYNPNTPVFVGTK